MLSTDIKHKINKLSSESKSFREISNDDRLSLINRCIDKFYEKKWIHAKSWIEHDLALVQLIPSHSTPKHEYTPYVSKFKSFYLYAITHMIHAILHSMQESLTYQIALEKGWKVATPTLLRRKFEAQSMGRKFTIFGSKTIPLFFHRFDLWTSLSPELSPKKMEVPVDTAKGEEVDEGGVSLVLGAGNQSVIAIFDVMQCLFIHPRKPVLIKHHPMRPFLIPLFEELFSPLIEYGILDQIVDGGIAETKAILTEDEIKYVHFTGGYDSSQAIAKTLASSRRDMTKEQVLKNMMTSELGCVTPWVFLPGIYSDSELRNAAKHIATSKKIFAGSNCLCANAIVLPQGWDQKQKLKDFIVEEMSLCPTDPCYYPGSKKKVQDIVSKYVPNQVKQIKAPISNNCHADNIIHPFLIDCGVPGEKGFVDYALTNEAFGPVLAFVELPGSVRSIEDYALKTVLPFINDKKNIFGTLSCSIMTPYKNKKKDEGLLNNVIAGLEYGTVAVNTFSFYGYVAIAYGGVWGASPFDTLGQSGRGYIGNYYGIPKVQKTVVYGPDLRFPPIADKRILLPTPITKLLLALKLSKSINMMGKYIKAVAALCDNVIRSLLNQ